MKSRIMYIERKTDVWEAFIGRVTSSKSGRTLYYRDWAFVPAEGRGIYGNYLAYDRATYHAAMNAKIHEEPLPGFVGVFWVSGPRKDGQDRRYDNRMPIIRIDEDAREEYWLTIREVPERVEEAEC